MKLSRIATAAVIVVSLSGCALGFNSPTQKQKPSTDGINVAAGAILVRDALLIVDPAHPTTAAFTGTLVNTGSSDETLDSIEGAGAVKGARFAPITLPAGQSVQIGFNSKVAVALYSATPIKISAYQPVTLTFSSSAAATLSLLVNPNTGLFADIAIPTVTDGALPGAEPSASPSASASPSPSAS